MLLYELNLGAEIKSEAELTKKTGEFEKPQE